VIAWLRLRLVDMCRWLVRPIVRVRARAPLPSTQLPDALAQPLERALAQRRSRARVQLDDTLDRLTLRLSHDYVTVVRVDIDVDR
jgi:hypothetical protein